MQYACAGLSAQPGRQQTGVESMSQITDYLGTLAVNLRLAAEAADELRADANADLRAAMGRERIVTMAAKMEHAAIGYRGGIADARRELREARSAARIAIDAAQTARREARL